LGVALGQALAFFSHGRELGAHSMVWSMLVANAFQQMALLGVFGYLVAYLLDTTRRVVVMAAATIRLQVRDSAKFLTLRLSIRAA
jgi:hypothetical protein